MIYISCVYFLRVQLFRSSPRSFKRANTIPASHPFPLHLPAMPGSIASLNSYAQLKPRFIVFCYMNKRKICVFHSLWPLLSLHSTLCHDSGPRVFVFRAIGSRPRLYLTHSHTPFALIQENARAPFAFYESCAYRSAANE